jgi:hypothetical protein
MLCLWEKYYNNNYKCSMEGERALLTFCLIYYNSVYMSYEVKIGMFILGEQNKIMEI